MEEYNYGYSPTNDYVLTRDGKEVHRGTEESVWQYLHSNHGYSVSHALQFEGYKIEPK